MSQQPRRQHRTSKSLVPAEGNFEEHPYFRVGDRNAGTGVLQYENELRTREGHILEQSWVVRAAMGRGLPGRFDQDVYVALLQLIDERGLPANGWLSFSIYELVELMGRGHSGRDYRQVRDSLLRMSSTTIESHNAFYHGGKKRYISDSFSLLSQVKLAEYEDPDGHRTDRNAVLLSNYFLESYQANYLKNIDSRFYWSLSSPIAKRLYRLIDKKRAGRRTWEAELFSLKDRIPLSDYRYASKIKEKLAPAHSELMAQEFLEDVSYRKSNDKEYAVYKISSSYQERRAIQSESLSKDEIFCIQRLKAEGMSADTAETMVASYGPGRIMQYVEALPHQRNVRNPAGWLRKAIENGYDLDLPPASSRDLPQENDPVVGEPETPLSHNTPESQEDDFPRRNGGSGEVRATEERGEPYNSSTLEEHSLSLDLIPKDVIDPGDFSEIVSTLESLPFEEYSRFIDAPSAVVDPEGNRFYLSPHHELYVYVGDVSPENLRHVCTIRFSPDGM
ncbi:replication initiator protein A [Rubrobacter aplysinae]|uniref:replication initiator protein A n=1 Tax=Rubrobacter aplysinae TaxID=909625 RepID=UPI00064BB13F|nr:replication initiator protein A [Rubrobacter aplysinae]